jgi:hypothetical protein
MGRGKRSPVTRYRIAAAILLALCVAGCGGNSYVQLGSSGSPAAGVSTGGSVSIQGRSMLGALIAIGILAGAPHAGVPEYEIDATRTVNEQDCSRPIANPTANLRCLSVKEKAP